MNTITTPPAPPAPPGNRRRLWAIGGTGIAVLAIVALAVSGNEDQAEATTPATQGTVEIAETIPAPQPTVAPTTTDEITDEDIDIMAMDLNWDAEAICGPFNQALDGGVDRDFLVDFGVQKFEEGYDSPLGPLAKAHLIELMNEC